MENLNFDGKNGNPTDGPDRMGNGGLSKTEWNNDPQDSKDDYEIPGGLD